jgi:hypothetical protein
MWSQGANCHCRSERLLILAFEWINLQAMGSYLLNYAEVRGSNDDSQTCFILNCGKAHFCNATCILQPQGKEIGLAKAKHYWTLAIS